MSSTVGTIFFLNIETERVITVSCGNTQTDFFHNFYLECFFSYEVIR